MKVDKKMNKASHIPIKISALILLIALFVLPIQQAIAQEIDAKQTPPTEEDRLEDARKKSMKSYIELSQSSGHVSYTHPELWNNNHYKSYAFRFIGELYKGNAYFINIEFADTNDGISDIDGLIRQSDYTKAGFGRIFNKSPARTTIFAQYEIGYMTAYHNIEGTTAWRAPEYDRGYYASVIHHNDSIYLQIELGIKIKNYHKLSVYYTNPILQATTSVTDNADNNSWGNPGDAGPFYHNIVNDMVGFRYSLILLVR